MAKFAKKPVAPEPVAQEPVAPKKPATGSLREKAKALSASLGISFKPGETPKTVINGLGTTRVSIANNKRNLKALKPTDEAIEAKDQVVALGREVIDQAYAEHEADLLANGTIPAGKTFAQVLQEKQQKQIADRAAFDDDYPVMALVSLINGEVKSLFDNASDEELASILAELAEKFNAPEFLEDGVLEKIKADKDYEFRVIAPPNPFGREVKDRTEEEEAEYKKTVEEFKRIDRLSDDTYEYVMEGRIEMPGLYRFKYKGDKNYTRPAQRVLPVRGGSISRGGGSANTLALRHVLETALLRRNEEASKKIKDYVDTKNAISDRVVESKDEIKTLITDFNAGIRDKFMERMKKDGFEFDSVSIEEFRRVHTPYGDRIKLTQAAGRDLMTAFSFMPKNVILAFQDYLEQKNLFLNLRQSNARGHFESRGRRTILPGPLIRTDSADTLLHELWHFVQYINRNVAVLENAYVYGRIADKDGNLPGVKSYKVVNYDDTIKEYKDEFLFNVEGISSDYMLKQYDEQGDFFDARNWATEVSTVGMQDLFTRPGNYSAPKGTIAMEGTGSKSKVHYSPYQDPSTGIWYTNSSKKTKINPHTITGRAHELGIDLDMKAFNVGLLLTLFNWES
jgi:hypothetical protein